MMPSRHSIQWRPPLPAYPELPAKPRSIHRHSQDWRGMGRIGQGGGSVQQLGSESLTLATTGATVGAMIAGASAIIPVIGIAGAIAGVLVSLLSQVFSGCGQSCVLTSDAANQIEQILQQNRNAYLQQSTRTKSEQAAFLSNFDNTWAKLVQYCGNPSFSAAGQRCVTDREQGSCAYHTTPGGWDASTCTYAYPGANNSGSECWNWFVGYRDPIALDPCVVADSTVQATPSGATPSQIAQGTSQIWGTASATNLMPLFLIGGLLLLAVIL